MLNTFPGIHYRVFFVNKHKQVSIKQRFLRSINMMTIFVGSIPDDFFGKQIIICNTTLKKIV